ncbi:DNA-binding transcriptional MerR regulator [Diaminobutyricimonas aerilata]|uniref:DNA-binding transcriptional MerR regulator n=1 Tax=Diaminobutyricimonas aerilata TaxID=1162967 RepID=A0A2M9CG66_9MICO|nr:MerR family transcriptional regulator [Diaminobutyricimonas aerilata]PJJ70924.1 DNA-binding transcriptional MerR regulator [Diaminobutyricimonas aerilata]
MLTISQLAAYAGVTVRAVRHYHQIGLLPEPERDRSGYRRYGAHAVVSLVKIATLADAGVPLSEIGDLVEADEETFAAAVRRIDRRLSDEIARLERSRTSIAELAAGDALLLPREVVAYLDRLRELGVSGPVLAGERDGWILMAARWPDRVRDWMPGKLASLDDPRIVRLYRVLSLLFDKSELDEPLMNEAADLMAELAEQAYEADYNTAQEAQEDAVPFDLLELLALETDPRATRMVELMRERGWEGWTRLEKVEPRATPR